MKRLIVPLCLVLLIFLAPIEYAAAVTIATGSESGTYYRIGRDLSVLGGKHGIQVNVIPSRGSVDNINLLKNRKADIAIVQSDVLGILKRIDPGIVDSIRVIFPLYTEEVHILASRKIGSLEAMARKKVAVGKKKSGTWVTATNLFYKMTVPNVQKITDLENDEALVSVLLGEIDAMFFVAGKPVALFQRLEEKMSQPEFKRILEKVHFVPLSAQRLLNEYYVSSALSPADYRWMASTVPTIGVKAYVIKLCGPGGGDDPCKAELAKLLKLVKKNIGELKRTGHPKWKTVRLGEAVAPPWKRESLGAIGVDRNDLMKLLEKD